MTDLGSGHKGRQILPIAWLTWWKKCNSLPSGWQPWPSLHIATLPLRPPCFLPQLLYADASRSDSSKTPLSASTDASRPEISDLRFSKTVAKVAQGADHWPQSPPSLGCSAARLHGCLASIALPQVPLPVPLPAGTKGPLHVRRSPGRAAAVGAYPSESPDLANASAERRPLLSGNRHAPPVRY